MEYHHRINYIEFSAPDLEAIKAFYTKTFGWEFTDYGPDYIAFNDGALEGDLCADLSLRAARSSSCSQMILREASGR